MGIAEDLDEGLKAYPVPEYMHAQLRRYVLERLPVGHFLTAVLSNNLEQSFNRADDKNRAALLNWVRLVYNYLPTACWGSPKAVNDWLKAESENAHE